MSLTEDAPLDESFKRALARCEHGGFRTVEAGLPKLLREFSNQPDLFADRYVFERIIRICVRCYGIRVSDLAALLDSSPLAIEHYASGKDAPTHAIRSFFAEQICLRFEELLKKSFLLEEGAP